MLACGCVSPTNELRGLAERPPLDRAVLVSGGAFFAEGAEERGTFGRPRVEGTSPSGEAIPFGSIVDVLERGAVFQRVVADDDPAHRRLLLEQLDQGATSAEVREFFQGARDDGFDLLLVIEELQDGPIERQGINGRWPVTFATWILLGVGAFIPDHTFESRSAVRISLRELQTGREVDSLLLLPGPIDLALTERTDVLGLVMSVVVPPFWVGDDDDAVVRSIREISQRRLLVSLVRELKSDVRRRRLGEREAAALTFERGPDGITLVVESREAISVARLVAAGLDEEVARSFASRLLASRSIEAGRLRYAATLPPELRGRFQVRVGTLRGGITSSTFRVEGLR
ncbi:MAG: hypothetical protein VYA51_00635 [Planctomycetota bacterium]|nr:hypothetical protein [Planctomycetota bacterium]